MELLTQASQVELQIEYAHSKLQHILFRIEIEIHKKQKMNWDCEYFKSKLDEAMTKVLMDRNDIAYRSEIDKGWITAKEVLNDPNCLVKKEDHQNNNSNYLYASYLVASIAIVGTIFYGYIKIQSRK